MSVVVAALVVTDPTPLVDTPEPPSHVDLGSTDTCHCTVGESPLAAAEKVPVWPEGTVWLMGWVVITGATAGMTVTAGGVGGSRPGNVGEHGPNHPPLLEESDHPAGEAA